MIEIYRRCVRYNKRSRYLKGQLLRRCGVQYYRRRLEESEDLHSDSTVSVHAMRTLTKYTTFSTPDNSINMAPIDDALAEIELLEPGEKFTYTEIANKYSLWRSTLTRRH